MKLEPKMKPRGGPFLKGNKLQSDPRHNHGGRPFIKLAQKLSTVSADMLSEAADVADCELVGLPGGATRAQCVVMAVYNETVREGNVTAAEALFRFTESPKIRTESVNINIGVFAAARDKLKRVMEGKELPPEVQP